MRTMIVGALLLGTLSFSACAQAADDMDCSHYSAMNASGRMAAVELMRSGMSGINMMIGSSASGAMSSADHTSTKQLAKKVSASCKGHGQMMVMDAMKGAMTY